MKTKTIYLTVRIDFEYDERKTNCDDAIITACELALNPNYRTISDGTKLENVEIYDKEVEF